MPAAEDIALRDLLVALGEEAAVIARSYVRANLRTWTKAYSSPVTEADIAIDRFLKLCVQLSELFYISVTVLLIGICVLFICLL